MGMFDMLKQGRKDAGTTRAALDEANDPSANEGEINHLIERILAFGIDGAGPYPSASSVAQKALQASHGDQTQAINKVVRQHIATGAAGGVATSIGGFITMPVALPVNVFEFYVQAAHMVGAVASLRGYDLTRPNVRTAILLTMVGSNSDDVLRKAGIATGGGRLAQLAAGRLPKAGMMMVNKAIGFRLLRTAGKGLIDRVGRGVPLAGGAVGGAIDGYMMKKIADQAMKEFPKQA